MDAIMMNVLMAVVVAIAGIIARSILPYLKAKKEEAYAALRQTKWAWAVKIIDAVVRAVEQTVSDEIHGEHKKDIALNYIWKLLDQNGIKISREQVDALLEAAVNEMNSGKQVVEIPEVRVAETVRVGDIEEPELKTDAEQDAHMDNDYGIVDEKAGAV